MLPHLFATEFTEQLSCLLGGKFFAVNKDPASF
jgi:hypothetical protein